jgi:hypothetical protein
VFSEEDEEGSGEPMTRWHVIGDDEEAAWYLTRIRPSRSGEGSSGRGGGAQPSHRGV